MTDPGSPEIRKANFEGGLGGTQDLVTYLAARGRLVDEALERALPPAAAPPAILHAAMRYTVFAGGKRLRPILVIASAEACGAAAADALPVACAVELINTYSLIHDDLPAMDNSDTRRGRATCHIAFGEAIAILAGDALHALAFELLGQMERTVGAARAIAVTREIATAIGTDGMVGGQVLDLLGEGRTFPGQTPSGNGEPASPPMAEVVREIHLRKTAALIRGAVRAGGMLGEATPAELEALSTFGERLGLAYQIVDDILDVVGEEARLGKRPGADAAKATYPKAFGLERSRDIATQLTAQAQEALRPLGRRGEVLTLLAGYLLHRDA